MGTLISGGVCTGLRGEEMLLIDLFGTAKSILQFMVKDSADPHFKFVIIGRTKGVQEDGHKFATPRVRETQGTHLRPGVWVDQLINVKRGLGQTHGNLFTRNLRQAKMYARSEYGLPQTTRRSATAHARNMRLPKNLMDVIHRWGEGDQCKNRSSKVRHARYLHHH
jgi:hypothetical protein